MKNVYKFDEPGTLSKPGWIGRLVRLLMAALMFYLLYVVLQNFNNFIEGVPEQAILWFMVLLAFFLLSPVVNIGFGKLWGNQPQSWFLIMLYILIMVGIFSKNAHWTLETAYLILGLQIYIFSHLGISFLLASIRQPLVVKCVPFHTYILYLLAIKPGSIIALDCLIV